MRYPPEEIYTDKNPHEIEKKIRRGVNADRKEFRNEEKKEADLAQREDAAASVPDAGPHVETEDMSVKKQLEAINKAEDERFRRRK